MREVWRIYLSNWRIWVYFSVILMQFYFLLQLGILKKYYWVAAIVVLIAPFYEWIVHKYILHTRVGKIHSIPKKSKHRKYLKGELLNLQIGEKQIEARVIAVEDDHVLLGSGWVKRYPALYHFMQDLHYGHHKNPNDVKYIIAPLWGGMAVIIQMFLSGYILSGFNWQIGLMTSFSVSIYYAYYEWVHLSHHVVSYMPVTSWGRFMRDLHTNHHFHHQNMWWGITNPIADYVLGTNKDRGKVVQSVHTHEINYEN